MTNHTGRTAPLDTLDGYPLTVTWCPKSVAALQSGSWILRIADADEDGVARVARVEVQPSETRLSRVGHSFPDLHFKGQMTRRGQQPVRVEGFITPSLRSGLMRLCS